MTHGDELCELWSALSIASKCCELGRAVSASAVRSSRIHMPNANDTEQQQGSEGANEHLQELDDYFF
jgi:hypothetical protein